MANRSDDVEIARAQDMRQGLRSPLHRGKKFPHTIAVAIVAITTGKAFPHIPRTARAVLAFAVRIAERKDPTKASWAFKKTIAHEIMVSESTVYRALNVLVNLGFIERFKQERKAHNGKLAVAKIALTRKTCLGLGLIITAEESKIEHKTTLRSRDFHTLPSVKLKDYYSSTLLLADQPAQSLKKHSPIPVITNQSLQRQLFFKLPGELSWLYEEKILTPQQIFLLMREFSARKQRFSEVLVVVSNRVRNLPKKDVFSYLRALTKAPTDFNWLAKQHNDANAKDKMNNDLNSLIQQLTKSMTGSYLQSNNNAVYLLDGSTARAWWLEEGRVREGSCPINARFAKNYETGCLRVIDQRSAKDLLAIWLDTSQRIYPTSRNHSNHRDDTGVLPRLGELLRSAIAKNYEESRP